jgi:Holliday junction resolvasome RuvABC endonuclease subunit
MNILGIDQSLNASGLCVVNSNGGIEYSTTISHNPDDRTIHNLAKVFALIGAVDDIVKQYKPGIIAMEEYARSIRGSASLVPLVELGGALKYRLWTEYRYAESYLGWSDGHRPLIIQNQSQMKKFCLGEGDTKKDSAYLLKVYKTFGISFADDNKADAFMHAHMAHTCHRVCSNELPANSLPEHQQEVLLGIGLKAAKIKSTQKKALKLTNTEKVELIRKGFTS